MDYTMNEDSPSGQLKREASERDLHELTPRPTKIFRSSYQPGADANKNTHPRSRPLSEPPIFDYTYLAQLVEAQKEITATRRHDLEWQFGAMDLELEWRLLQMYRNWARVEHQIASESGSEKEEEFLKNLEMDINGDLGAVFEEQQIFDQSCGKEVGRWFDLYDKIHRRIR